jgi:hypothetical protein
LETVADFANPPRAATSRRLAGGRDMQIVLDLQKRVLLSGSVSIQADVQ